MNMLCLQVCWGQSKLLVLQYLSFVYKEVFPWPSSSKVLGLLQLKPAPILEWWPKEWAYCRRVLGCHPLPGCMEKELGRT